MSLSCWNGIRPGLYIFPPQFMSFVVNIMGLCTNKYQNNQIFVHARETSYYMLDAFLTFRVDELFLDIESDFHLHLTTCMMVINLGRSTSKTKVDLKRISVRTCHDWWPPQDFLWQNAAGHVSSGNQLLDECCRNPFLCAERFRVRSFAKVFVQAFCDKVWVHLFLNASLHVQMSLSRFSALLPKRRDYTTLGYRSDILLRPHEEAMFIPTLGLNENQLGLRKLGRIEPSI